LGSGAVFDELELFLINFVGVKFSTSSESSSSSATSSAMGLFAKGLMNF
jgi:hypothetical protein